MLSDFQSNLLTKILAIGSFLVTITVYSGIGYDPVNLPKLALITIMAGICFGLVSYSLKAQKNLKKFIFSLPLAFFILGLIFNLIFGRSPLSMNFYGTYGRNTGVLTYLCLVILTFGATLIKQERQFMKIIKYFIFAIVINLFYGLFIFLNKRDPLPWSNPNANFLGTLGNPDFISAFLGMGSAMTFAIAFRFKNYLRYLLFLLIPIQLFLIDVSKALQGYIVSILGFGVVIYFLIRSNFNRIFERVYLSISTIIGSMIILGMLQIGPLTDYVYKTSVSIRGSYWRAGIRMFIDSPFWGIGLDSYGDFYRRFRDLKAITLPGVNVVTDTAHNVYIDLLAGGGLLLIVPYIAFQVFVFYTCYIFWKKNKEYDPIFVTLLVGWITYLAQSIVSINQIGLAIWGWLFAGLIIGYVNNYKNQSDLLSENKKSSKMNIQSQLTPGNYLWTIIISVLFTIVAAFPVVSEYKWRTSLKNGSIEQIIANVNGSPKNNQRFIQTAQMLFKSNFNTDGVAVLKLGIDYDPDFRDYWYFLYNLSSNKKDRELALSNLKRLDPLNKAQS